MLGQPLPKERWIGEAGEGVVVRQVVELFLLGDMVERERNVAGQLQEQLHLRRVEKARLAGVQREHPHDTVGSLQRQNGERSQATAGCLF